MSDDGAFAFVVIALVGNPFSPWYAKQRGRAIDFAAMNVCIYGPRGRSWALTERAIDPSHRNKDGVRIGASTMRWDSGALVVELDERTSPMNRPIHGVVRFEPEHVTRERVMLGDAHAWWPVAPRGRVRVELASPKISFSGSGYHDANAGSAPLEQSLSRWSWSRAPLGDRTLVTYDSVDRGGTRTERAWIVSRAGALEDVSLPVVELPTTRWFRVRRDARSEGPARVVRELEDTPFYARALVSTRALGRDVIAMHETVSLDRFRARWVRALLGYRMARAR